MLLAVSSSIRLVTIMLLQLLLVGWSYAGEVQTGIDEQAQLPYWELTAEGMSLRLVQRLPIQTRGYFLARGFDADNTEKIAQSCVFQTVFKNTVPGNTQRKQAALTYDMNQWVITYQGKKRRLKTREDWNREWDKTRVSQAARIAFEWSLYPTRQEYKPGDYNWGMSIFNLKPGARFDLEISWRQFGRLHKGLIRNIECAADINPQPKGNL